MRIAAAADLHFTPQNYDRIREQMNRVRDEADLLVLAGDLTNFGRPAEMESLLNVLVRMRVPIVAVLGNHDYESGHAEELMKMMTSEGIKVLDGTAYERDGVGFAGTKGFPGGFGRGVLTAFGEPEVKAFVQAAIDEALKLERAPVAASYRPSVWSSSTTRPSATRSRASRPRSIPTWEAHGWPRSSIATARTWCYTAMPTAAAPTARPRPDVLFTTSRYGNQSSPARRQRLSHLRSLARRSRLLSFV